MVALKAALALCSVLTLVSARNCPVADVSVIAHTGTPQGKEEVHNGVNMYIARPSSCGGPDKAKPKVVLYLTDVFGIQLPQNKLLADSFARAGFVTVAPDLFDGAPAPHDINVPGFNTSQFLAAHGPNVTDPIIAKTIAYIQNELKITSIGATGYCFGGRYAYRFGAQGKGATAVFTAHPSLLEDGEIVANKAPSSIAAAETDALMSAARRNEIQTILQQTGTTYSIALYSGTSHGFGVRANISDPEQKFGKEEAFFQAVRWFDVWA